MENQQNSNLEGKPVMTKISRRDVIKAQAVAAAAEAYRDDVPSPLQAQLPLFKGFEWKIEQAIGERFGVDLELISS